MHLGLCLCRSFYQDPFNSARCFQICQRKRYLPTRFSLSFAHFAIISSPIRYVGSLLFMKNVCRSLKCYSALLLNWWVFLFEKRFASSSLDFFNFSHRIACSYADFIVNNVLCHKNKWQLEAFTIYGDYDRAFKLRTFIVMSIECLTKWNFRVNRIYPLSYLFSRYILCFSISQLISMLD